MTPAAATTNGPRRAPRAGRAAAALLVLLLAGAAGGDDWVLAPRPPGAEEERRQNLVQLDQQLDAMFQQGGAADALRKQLSARLSVQVQALDAVCGLTEPQRGKCNAAADLQSVGLLQEVETVRGRYAGVSVDFRDAGQRKVYERMQREAQAVVQRVQRGGGTDGLLARVMNGILDERQRALWTAETRARDEYHRAAVIAAGLAQIEVTLGLTTRKRDQLHQLMLDEAPRFNPDGLRAQPQFAMYAAFYALSRIDEAKLKPLFTDAQWQALRQFREQGRGMRQQLQQMGVLGE